MYTMDDKDRSLSVVDVYDSASAIGLEFEKIIETCGPEVVSNLMPKVILVLEHLEVMATKNQKENEQVTELQYTIDRLQVEKRLKAEEKEKYEMELEQIEESWRSETKNLWDSISQLQDDNRRLRASNIQETSSTTKEITVRLKETVEKQKDYIKGLQQELVRKTCDLDAVQSQVERLSRLNADYRRKNSLTQRQANCLIQEKAQMQAQIHDMEQQIIQAKPQLEENSDLPPSETESRRIEERLRAEGKMIIDLNDPERPRFTLNELKDVLHERNELKSKLCEVEEELQTFKPEEPKQPEEQDTFDLPVFGPINKEPDDKLYGRSSREESGVRKLFHRFLEQLNLDD